LLTRRLKEAAARLGFAACDGALVTLPQLATGGERQRWAEQGFVAADMETGLILADSPHLATVRVVVDAPGDEISPPWTTPERSLLRPRLWPEAARLALAAPRHALRAAAIAAAAL
jgi:hypothetical protein